MSRGSGYNLRVNIVGLSAFYHESACCLLQHGRLIAAAAEERFSRLKHDARLPTRAFRYCLEAGGLTLADVDCIAYYESPVKKHQRQLWSGMPRTDDEAMRINPERPLRDIREKLGYDGQLLTFDHHLSHAASAFYFSGFEEAAVLTVDGVGEWATTTYGQGRGKSLEIFEEVQFPHSLGLLYAAITAYLGFHVNSGESKVMGLAPYGRPQYVEPLRRLIQSGPNGQFRLDMTFFDFVQGERMFSPRLPALFDHPPREPDAALQPFHQDLARSLQVVLEEILLDKVEYLAGRVRTPNLCLAGGVALNCVANGRIRREGPFANLFIQPAAGDAGGCLGAAALAHIQLTGERHARDPLTDVYLGPGAGEAEICRLLSAAGIVASDFREREEALLAAVADRLERNEIIGWFQGRMEFGPRALGARSILANPLDPTMRDRLNQRVKKREEFRPFAPAVLAELASTHFDLGPASPFMLETCQVISSLSLPAVTHVDGSARPQTVDAAANPRFAALLRAFYRRTGCPVLLNTSLNIRGEPIACTPVDALFCLVRADLDALVLGDFLIERTRLPPDMAALVAVWETAPAFAFSRHHSVVHEGLYSFV